MYIYIYIYIYMILYTHAAADKTIVVHPTKSSSDNRGGIKQGFGARASLSLSQCVPAVAYNLSVFRHVVGKPDQDTPSSINAISSSQLSSYEALIR